jgi:glycosyltransferase involved in cell wall biosynthesis
VCPIARTGMKKRRINGIKKGWKDLLGAKPAARKDSTRFLVILYGTLEYDGRVKRMLDIITRLGEVELIDVSPGKKKFNGTNNEYRIRRLSIGALQKTGKFNRHIRFWLNVLRRAWHAKPAVVVAEDFFTCFPALLAAKLIQAKLVYDAHELIIPECGVKMSPRRRFWYLLERLTVGHADLVIAANAERAGQMATHYGLRQVPEVMRNIPPMANQSFNPAKLIQEYPVLTREKRDEKILIYQGDVSLSRGIGRFLEALEYLPSCYRLIVAGGGPDLDKLRAMGQRYTKENRFLAPGRIENKQLPSITAQADVGIVCYPYEGLNNIYCAPNKLFEYAQAGVPVVATDQPPLRKAFETFKIGELVGEKDSPEQIALILQKVMNDKNRYCQQLESFLDASRWEHEAKGVRRAFENILGILT